MNHLQKITHSILPLQKQLLTHPINESMKSLPDVRVFMENHVFAVWDFMVILKVLQRSLICTEMVWLPAANSQTSRLISEIGLCEESDEDGEGGYASHFELYHRAMQRCGANTAQIDRFVNLLRNGTWALTALRQLDVPKCTRSFIYRTISTTLQGQACEIAASFAFSRENLLPHVFERVVAETERLGDGSLDAFVYYLSRHIEVDDDSHRPMAEQMIASLCGDDILKWQLAEESAIRALRSRITFWDGVLEQIQLRSNQPGRGTEPESNAEVGDHFLASAIQLGWLSGLTPDKSSHRLSRAPRDQIASIIGTPEDDSVGPKQLDARDTAEERHVCAYQGF